MSQRMTREQVTAQLQDAVKDLVKAQQAADKALRSLDYVGEGLISQDGPEALLLECGGGTRAALDADEHLKLARGAMDGLAESASECAKTLTALRKRVDSIGYGTRKLYREVTAAADKIRADDARKQARLAGIHP